MEWPRIGVVVPLQLFPFPQIDPMLPRSSAFGVGRVTEHFDSELISSVARQIARNTFHN